MVAAAGMDRVVQQRLAVRRERHAPGDAVQPAGEDVARDLRRALRKPGGVDELQQHAALVARPGRLRVDHRPGDVDFGHAALARPVECADAVVGGLRRDLEARRVRGEQPPQLGFARLRDAERVVGGAREDPRDFGARQRRAGRRRVADHARAGGRRQRLAEGRARFLLVAAHARGERDRRQRVQAEHAARRQVVVGHRRALEQRAPRGGVREVRIAQQAAAALRALQSRLQAGLIRRVAQAFERAGGQVQDLVVPRLEIERTHALGERRQRGLVQPRRAVAARRAGGSARRYGKPGTGASCASRTCASATFSVERAQPSGAFAQRRRRARRGRP